MRFITCQTGAVTRAYIVKRERNIHTDRVRYYNSTKSNYTIGDRCYIDIASQGKTYQNKRVSRIFHKKSRVGSKLYVFFILKKMFFILE